MEKYHLSGIRKAFDATLLLAFALTMQSASAGVEERADTALNKDRSYANGGHFHERRIRQIRGVTVTGVNSVLGKPFFSWGAPYGASFGFATMGAFNEYGAKPIPLDAYTPDSAILASYIDPIFLAISGKPPNYVPNPAWLNVPLRQVPVNVDFAFVKKEPLRGAREAARLEFSQAEPANPITLGQWMKARGVATVECSGSGADFRLRMKSLIPNRTYTVWAGMGVPSPSSVAPAVFPMPLGGAPSVFMTDENGDGTFKRWMNFCPFDTQPTESPLLFVDVHFVANHQTYGAAIAPGFVDGNWPGIITFSHVVFPISVEAIGN